MPSLVEICSTHIKSIKGISQKTQKPYELRLQSAYLHPVEGGGYPKEFEIMLEAGEMPNQVGMYHLSDHAVQVGRNGRLEVRPNLVSVKK